MCTTVREDVLALVGRRPSGRVGRDAVRQRHVFEMLTALPRTAAARDQLRTLVRALGEPDQQATSAAQAMALENSSAAREGNACTRPPIDRRRR
jgi:hypothetical protein